MTGLADLDATLGSVGLAAELEGFNARLQAFGAQCGTPQPLSRPLAEIIAGARQANCGQCWQVPGPPCTRDPDGVHVARLGRAFRRGLISGPDLIAALRTAGVFTLATVICDAPGGAR